MEYAPHLGADAGGVITGLAFIVGLKVRLKQYHQNLA